MQGYVQFLMSSVPGDHTGPTGKQLGFLPLKECAPKILAKLEQWRTWKADMLEYLEAISPSMKELMTDAANQPEDLAMEH